LRTESINRCCSIYVWYPIVLVVGTLLVMRLELLVCECSKARIIDSRLVFSEWVQFN
jgi:hypothetical protein